MISFIVILSILVTTLSADASRLASNYLPTKSDAKKNHYNSHLGRMQMPFHYNQSQTNQHFETIIEKHEVLELPTQVEILADSQAIYGVQQLSSDNSGNENVMKTPFNYLAPPKDFENFSLPLVPYKVPSKVYLPPIKRESLTTEKSSTIATSTDNTTSNLFEEETNTEPFNAMNDSIETVQGEKLSHDATTVLPKIATTPGRSNIAQTSLTSPNKYLPPIGIILPPSEKPAYQKYLEQLLKIENLMVMKGEKRPVEQPIAPLEYDSPNYETPDGHFNHFRLSY